MMFVMAEFYLVNVILLTIFFQNTRGNINILKKVYVIECCVLSKITLTHSNILLNGVYTIYILYNYTLYYITTYYSIERGLTIPLYII